MEERTFGEKLKKYRTQKRYTQQQLAERLGVSDKTVSKWECGGGYPDVALLVPLARALDATVDDLLDGQNPVRRLQRQDWQNFLAFAFSLGGGLLYFLICKFAPMLLGYFLYLGCAAYGAYLQKYYCYKTRWFTLTSVGMLAFVHVALCLKLVVLVSYPWSAMYGGALLAGTPESPTSMVWLAQMISPFLLALVLAAVLTGTGAVLLLRYLGGVPLKGALRRQLGLAHPQAVQLWTCLALLVQAGFAALYAVDLLPGVFYLHQSALLWGLTGLCWLALINLYRKKRRWGTLALATLCLAVGGLLLFAGSPAAWNRSEGHVLRPELFSGQLARNTYAFFRRPSLRYFVLAALLAAAYLVLCCVRVKRPSTETQPQA